MSQQPPPQNEPSLLLTDEENELVFNALGHRRQVRKLLIYIVSSGSFLFISQTKATAVVQMYHAHPDPYKWVKYKTGVACFVKDNLRKSYYVRLLELSVS